MKPCSRLCRLALIPSLGLLLVAGCSTRPTPPSFPEASSLAPQAGMPDPLTLLDGRKVTSRAQWVNQRRPELKALFAHYVYGAIPPKPAQWQVQVVGEYPDFLGGQATLKLVTLATGATNAPRIDLMLVLPNGKPTPAPVFLAMDFCGNHALTADPRVPLARSWLADGCKGCTNNAATEAARGTQAGDWPLAEIVRRGYGLAAFYSGDVDPDRAEVSQGLYAWLAGGDPAKNSPADRGTIAAWAWGFQRCVDYLVTDRGVDARRIAAVGHSRNGKTALLAAAFDERIAMAFPHQAGCGGTAPSRGKTGESVKAINDRFPHWFNRQFKQFNETPERLPLDQNCLVALCAPRPVLISAAEGDQWSNPAGQFEVVRAADPVYRFLGVEGCPVTQMPPLRQLVGQRLGYYIREGKHSMTADDWNTFMNFADRNWQH
ncbi:MAG TPA: acetylxylan esterase [Bacillota bacterium]|nr:acetylxylan esterase [Bacillota bacterium]